MRVIYRQIHLRKPKGSPYPPVTFWTATMNTQDDIRENAAISETATMYNQDVASMTMSK